MPFSADLRREIEDLALNIAVSDPGDSASAAGDWKAALARIRDRATREQAVSLASLAAEILGSMERSDGSDLLDEGMRDRLTRLQDALEAPAVSHPPARLAEDPELVADFVLEAREHLLEVEAHALTLERDPLNTEALHAAFRGFHTIKGLAGFLELREVQELAHEVEAILDRARNGEMTIGPEAIDAILQAADHLRRWIAHLELELAQKPSGAPPPDAGLLSRIRALASGGKEEPTLEMAAPVMAAPDTPLAPDMLAVAALAPDTPLELDTPLEADAAAEKPMTAAAASNSRSAMSVKVDTAKLDALVDMAGELVIAESLVRHDAEQGAARSPGLQRKMAQLTRITGELQKTAMAMRLVSIGPLFRRMTRLVRDLSRQFGKRVEIETQGDDIELDRTIVEELGDPLMHMVRNSIDHGIESPEERRERGKSPVARLLLKAQHQGGQVVVEIADDGRGLDRDRIRAKAIERGLISSGDGLSDAEIYSQIFLPGFSTAAQVTNVSGRGVGMDVVRRHIEKLRGRIDIQSSMGQGARFLLKLPLTLAIIDGLVVGVGTERYIVPLFAVRELFRPNQDTIWTVRQRAEMALVRGSLLPVLRLYRRFGVTPRTEDPNQSVLIVSETEGRRFCLLVDELIGKQEVVIKSLGETFRDVGGIAGGAILGDGRVGLILDLQQLMSEQPHADSAA